VLPVQHIGIIREALLLAIFNPSGFIPLDGIDPF
jgi:hypothetical protein